MKKYGKYILLLLGAIVLLAYIESITPQEIDWTPSFSLADKVPYGSYTVYDHLPEIVGDGEPLIINSPLFLFLAEEKPDGLENLIFINTRLAFDEFESAFLNDFADSGGTVFLAGWEFPAALKDSLGFEVSISPYFEDDSLQFSLTNPNLNSDSLFSINQAKIDHYFSEFDTSSVRVLGQNQAGRANFLLYPRGEGAFLLHSAPLTFTNYFFMNDTMRTYILSALSYLPDGRTAWDEYHKIGRQTASTPIRFILSRPGLQKAYGIGIAGILLFLLFNSKRRQRMIPVVPPIRNLSLEFVKTVGRLYYINRDHRNLAIKKVNHFLEYLRLRYFVRTETLNNEIAAQVSGKSGFDQQEIRLLFRQIDQIRQSKEIGAEQLKQLNKKIENFYRKTQ